VCARIGLVNKADEELVHAKVIRAINNYLSPEVHFYSLKQMLDKGLLQIRFLTDRFWIMVLLILKNLKTAS
jgi:hypothetical protein